MSKGFKNAISVAYYPDLNQFCLGVWTTLESKEHSSSSIWFDPESLEILLKQIEEAMEIKKEYEKLIEEKILKKE